MENKIICGIYRITSLTGRIYIGESKDIYKRFEQYRFLSNTRNQTKLHRSFKKHGIVNHIFEIIEECASEDLLCRERYWQDFYNVLDGGLNCQLSNCGEQKRVTSEETKQKISKTKKESSQTDAQKAFNLKKFGWKRPKHPEWQKNNSEARKKPILQYSLDEEFVKEWDSAKDVQEVLGFNRKAIYKNLSGNSKSSFGYIWKYKNK